MVVNYLPAVYWYINKNMNNRLTVIFHTQEAADRTTSGVDCIRISWLGEGSLGFQGRVDYQQTEEQRQQVKAGPL